LNRDFSQLGRGIPAKYGANWELVVETMGWSKQQTRHRPEVNNGQPPDTCNALLGWPKKLGRPTGSANIMCDPHFSYQSFSASMEPGKRYQC
ncbi:hypothetical protein DFH28DRAFT_883578, partial [Melampsora americana]